MDFSQGTVVLLAKGAGVQWKINKLMTRLIRKKSVPNIRNKRVKIIKTSSDSKREKRK